MLLCIVACVALSSFTKEPGRAGSKVSDIRASNDPSISHPSDAIFTLFSVGHTVSWIVTDASVGVSSYTIYRDADPIANGSWSSGISITENIDTRTVGNYLYIIVVSDGLGGVSQDEVVVRIRNTIPSVSHPIDTSFVQFSDGNTISWTVSDANIDTTNYIIYRDGIQIASGSWNPSEKVTVGIDTFSKGTYRYKVVVNDGLGGTAQDEVMVTVIENYPFVYTIWSLVIVVGVLFVFGLYRYQKSPVAVQRKARRVEMERIEREKYEAELRKAAEEIRKAKEKVREERARIERERAEKEEREKKEKEESKMREAFKKFMAEEQGNTVADVDKMFDEWKNKKEKI